MPQINLLVTTRAKKPTKTASRQASAGVPLVIPRKITMSAVGVVAAVVLFWVIVFAQIVTVKKQLAILGAQEKQSAIDPKELVKLSDKKKSLEEQLVFIDVLLVRPFIWHQKISDIARLIPDGVWLTSLSLESRAGSAKGAQWAFVIRGKSVSPRIDDAIGLMGQFNSLLQGDEMFARDFDEIKLGAVNKETIAKTDVMNFELVCMLKK